MTDTTEQPKKKTGRKRGSTARANQLRRESHEEMRLKLNFSRTLTAIDGAEGRLVEMMDQGEEPSAARVGAVKALLDSKWKRMEKIIPSLKAIEVKGEDGGAIRMAYSFDMFSK